MDSGTENMDWVAAGLKRIIEFTQAGGEINVVVAGINVGAQPYWNAEATMLMHTKGILVMTPDSAMVLTGKQSLDFSGGVSAEDNFGIGGYDRVMGPNGQAQYWAPDLAGAFGVLLAHYDHTYVVPGESRPRRAPTTDPSDRDVSSFPHQVPESDFTTVGEIFSATANPDRKKAFDIRTVMRALSDQDHPTLERWAGMADAETAVVQDAHLGGYPVCLLGIESRPLPRRGFPPTDGPDVYTAGTLFPRSSKKAARAINAASGNRPLVVLANLSGFDGSPDSMRNLQLEYGAEIGRAIVNFDGPIVFCVISRYHGGAFVVFSKALNPNMTVLALEGSYASVIGGAPAAAVVFAGEVEKRTSADPRVRAVEGRLADATGPERSHLVVELADLRAEVRPEKISEVAAEFDGVHDIHRAVRVGSVDEVISVARLRPRVIEAIERGLDGAGTPTRLGSVPHMPIKLENVGIAVRDIDETIAFFTDLGLTVLGQDTVSGEWADTAVGLDGNHAKIAMLQTPDGNGRLELFEYIHPDAIETEPTLPHEIGMHRVAFSVDDLDAALEIAARHGCHPLRGVATYEDVYKLTYLRGPSGILVMLAEELKAG